MRSKITLFLMCFLVGNIFAQQRECSTMENLEFRKQQNPQLEFQMNQIEQFTQAKIIEMQQNRVDGNIITIPVVVHVIYSNANENISDAQIQSQIDVLNEDFRRLNTDADNTWSQAADTEIQFCLSTIDPDGNVTNGITRKSSTRTSWGTNDAMKSSSQGGVDAWNTSEYLNMWVCNIGGGILGYAQFPGGSAATDGVVMGPQYFGSSAKGSGFYLSSPFDLGRTTTHEVGHFFNLRHIWGDGGCQVDDFVSDTPNSNGANYGCDTGSVSCSSTDMVENYMDYSDDSCMNLYTQGQKDRMRAVLASGGFRRSLALSDKCNGVVGPTCTDGVQNGDETGIDCGGPDCDPCQTTCDNNSINISITLDNYPEETAWALTDSSNQTVASGSYSTSNPNGSTVTEDLCLPNGCYTFTITDSYGDGICCSYGNGSYNVTDASGSLASGGSFGSSESTEFCLGSDPEPTCTDGVQNGNETGIDCGGSDCEPCQTGTTILHEGYFETGWDGWSDGGGDCYRYSGSRSYEGNYSIRIRDNSGTRSAMTSEVFNLTSFNQIEVEFYFYSYSMENGEDFWLRYYNGSSWSTVATYARGTDFNNNTFYTATVTLDASQVNFATNSQFRFQCDASVNNDHIYIDQVKISGINGNTRVIGNGITPLRTLNESANEIEEDFIMYPNPVKGNVLNIKMLDDKAVSYRIINILGQPIKQGKTNTIINVSDLNAGVYFLEINDGEDIMLRKFIKQ